MSDDLLHNLSSYNSRSLPRPTQLTCHLSTVAKTPATVLGTRSLGCTGHESTKTNAFRTYSATTAPSSPSSYSKPVVPLMGTTPTTTTVNADGQQQPYRFASIERLIHRKKIYDCNSLPVMAKFEDVTSPVEYTYSLSQKRELFFRQDGTPGSNAANNANSAAPSVPNVNNYLSSSSMATGNNSNIGNGIKESITTGNNTNASLVSMSSYSTNKEVPVRDQRNLMTSATMKELQGYVGYANLPNQVYRKAIKRGFEFTLMVVGESGLGKSTLINSMFLTDIYSNEYPGPSRRTKKTVQVETSKVLLKENGVDLKLTIVDTPGFGDAVDNSECWQPLIDFIENKSEEYLNAESCVNRRVASDSRVHCCLYFIAPSGHGLKPLDVEFMKRLHDKVNILPLIAKADTMTPEECSMFKKTILTEIARNKIRIYEFPDSEDEDDSKQQKYLKERVPFAVVGSNTIIEVGGKRLRGRRYPWGVAEVENMEHCDFVALRNMLITTHMQDLKDVTNNVHYENFRCRKLAGVGNDGKPVRVSNKNPLAQMEEEKKEHEQKMKRMEQEMEQVFELKVREKMQKLKDSENDLQRRHEQMKKSLESQRQEIEEKWREFEKEKSIFDATNKADEFLASDVNSKEDSKEKKKKKGLF